MELIKDQNSSGNWTFSDKTLKVLNISMENFQKEMPTKLTVKASDKLNAWMTIVILACLQEFFNDKKKSWGMIETKAMQWLKTQSITFDQFQDRARVLLFMSKD